MGSSRSEAAGKWEGRVQNGCPGVLLVEWVGWEKGGRRMALGHGCGRPEGSLDWLLN